MIARQFLLCSINIKNKNIWSELINNSESIKEKDIAAKNWTLKKQNDLSYSESSSLGDSSLDYRQALEKTRNLDLLWNSKVETSSSLQKPFKQFLITQRDSSLVVDYHGNFLLIMGYTIEYNNDDEQELIAALFKNRAVIDNVNDRDWFATHEANVKQEVVEYVNTFTQKEKLTPENIELNPDAAFPLLYSSSPASKNLPNLFKNEESLEQRTKQNSLMHDYEKAFFHVGWNYTLASHFPEDVNEHIFSLLTKMQMSYYKLRYYKEYFNVVFNDILKNSEAIDSEQVDFFDKLKLNYNVFLANYYKYKYGLYPKYNEVMNNVERLWNMDKDTEILNQTFNAQTEFVNKKFSETSQRLNDKRNQTLNIIALLQIIAFVSVIYDSLAFKEKWPFEFYTVIVFLVLSVTTAVSLFLSLGVIRKRKPRK